MRTDRHHRQSASEQRRPGDCEHVALAATRGAGHDRMVAGMQLHRQRRERAVADAEWKPQHGVVAERGGGKVPCGDRVRKPADTQGGFALRSLLVGCSGQSIDVRDARPGDLDAGT